MNTCNDIVVDLCVECAARFIFRVCVCMCECLCIFEQTLNWTHIVNFEAIRNGQLEYTLFTAYCPGPPSIPIKTQTISTYTVQFAWSMSMIFVRFLRVNISLLFIYIFVAVVMGFRFLFYVFFLLFSCPLPLNVVLMDDHLWCRQVKILCIIVQYIVGYICVPKTILFLCFYSLVSLQQIAADQTIPHCKQYGNQVERRRFILAAKYDCITRILYRHFDCQTRCIYKSNNKMWAQNMQRPRPCQANQYAMAKVKKFKRIKWNYRISCGSLKLTITSFLGDVKRVHCTHTQYTLHS